MLRKLIFISITYLFLSASLHAATLTVSQNGSGQFSTINDALSAATDGDLILVDQGTYHETLWVEKSITIEAAAGRPITAIDGNGTDRGMVIGQGAEVTLRGLTFSNCNADDASALLIWNQACVIVEDCAFVDNYASGSNAVHLRHLGTMASFYRCDFVGNDCGAHSAALSMSLDGELLVEDCFFARNTSGGASGAVNCNSGVFSFRGNLFLLNSAEGEGALVIQDTATGTIANNTFHENSGSGCVSINHGTLFQNNIITSTVGGPGLYAPVSVLHSCNLYYDNEGGPVTGSALGENEEVADPRYCDYPAYIFTLCEISPALGNNNDCQTMGAFIEGCSECGMIATQTQTLGGLKSLYR